MRSLLHELLVRLVRSVELTKTKEYYSIWQFIKEIFFGS